MLYGYKANEDMRLTTMVVAASTIIEFETWADNEFHTEIHPESLLFIEGRVSNFMDAMVNDAYKGYKRPLYIFYHTDEEQRDAFIKKHNIELVQTAIGRDKQADMLWLAEQTVKDEHKDTRKELFDKREKEIEELYKTWRKDIDARKAALQARKDAGEELTEADEIPEEDLIFYIENEYAEKTIGEELGLSENDPWDRRSEEEIEQEKAIKEKIEKAKKAGKLSGESFGGPVERDKGRSPVDLREPKQVSNDSSNTDSSIAPEQINGNDGDVFVTKINVEHDSSGNIIVKGVNAIKKGGEINKEELEAKVAERETMRAESKAKTKLSPDAFAAALRGDGRTDCWGTAPIEGDKEKIKDKSSGKKRKGL
jgi:hypothetical protein